jgi:hypothetical protein
VSGKVTGVKFTEDMTPEDWAQAGYAAVESGGCAPPIIAKKVVPRSECIYGTCRAVNLCKGAHCVGAGLRDDGYEFKDGSIVKIAP